MSVNEDARRLAMAIVNFLRTELSNRPDISLQDRDNFETAIECLESAYSLHGLAHTERRPLLDMYLQVASPVSVKDKQRADALKEAGNSKMANQQFLEAEQYYSQAIELDKWNSVYFCNRAGARIRLEQYYEALSDCRQAVQLNPDYAKAYGRMGQAYARMDRHRRAARCFRKALELDPDDETYRRNLMVAERRAAEDPASIMASLIQGLLSSILGGGAGGMPFVIMSDSPSVEDSESGQTSNRDGEESSSDLQTQQTFSGSGTEESSTDSNEETILIRVLYGTPLNESGGETNQETGDGSVSPAYDSPSDPEERKNSVENQRGTHQVNANLEGKQIGHNEESKKEKKEAYESQHTKKNIDDIKPLNSTSENEKATTPVTVKEASIDDADTNQISITDEGTSNKNGTTQAAAKDTQKESNSLPELAKESSRDETRESKQPVFNLSEISSFFKNFGRSASNSEAGKSSRGDDKKKNDNEKTDTDEVSNAPEDERNDYSDMSKSSKEK